jgi:hypothetical protein
MSEQKSGRSITFSSFADWYLQKDSLSQEAKHTVDILLKMLGTSDINEANRILSTMDDLSLDECYISDITPLQSLTNLSANLKASSRNTIICTFLLIGWDDFRKSYLW